MSTDVIPFGSNVNIVRATMQEKQHIKDFYAQQAQKYVNVPCIKLADD